MKSKKKKESIDKFADKSADKDFKKLMQRLGVKELTEKPEAHPPAANYPSSEPIRFIDHQGWHPNKVPTQKEKYGNSPKPNSSAATKRKIKITPGFIPDAEIDLHGLTKVKALQKTKDFIDSCRQNKCQAALIITGRGLNSGKGEGVLRNATWNWLINNSNGLRITCRWAPAFLGGSGAIIVFFN